jgi:hypothetical protein
VAVDYSLESGILTIHATGRYRPEDVPHTFVKALADPACPTPVGLLLDVTGSEVLSSRSTEQIRSVAEFLQPYVERIGRRCAVVAAENVHFGLSRMGAVFAGNIGVDAQVFRSRETAVAWLKSGARAAAGRDESE